MKKINYAFSLFLATLILISSNMGIVNADIIVLEKNTNDNEIKDMLFKKTNLFIRPIKVKTYDNIINLKTYPTIINNKSYIPLRKTLESLDFNVIWNGKTQTIEVSNGSFIFNISVKENKVFIDEMVFPLKDPLTIINGNTMFSIESIEQLMFGQLKWSEDNRIIDISSFDIKKIEAMINLTNALFNKRD